MRFLVQLCIVLNIVGVIVYSVSTKDVTMIILHAIAAILLITTITGKE